MRRNSDTIGAFMRARSSERDTTRTFDWDKASEIIAEKKPKTAHAGLAEDWGYTGGCIFENGKPVKEDDTYVYLTSNWATPILVLDDDEEIECWKLGDGREYWPDSSRAKLSRSDVEKERE